MIRIIVESMLYLVSSLVVCIFLHELGHLIVAKLCKCNVEIFSIGFGKKIIGKQFGSTYYQISWLLLGGYCKLKGENEYLSNKDAFTELPYMKKFYISIAGCVVNIITGIIAFIIGWNFFSYALLYFSLFSISLGLFNLIPFAPCLDGGYIVYLPIYYKKYGEVLGFKKFNRASQISLKIIHYINIISLPIFIYIYWMTLIKL